MQDLTVTLVQVDQVWEDKKANLEMYEKQFAKIEDTHLILLPEMFQTGFSMNTELAESYLVSPSIQWLKEKARDKKAAIYTSLMIKDEGKTTNRGVFVFPNGQVEYYDKRKTFTLAGEHQHFSSGREVKIVEYMGWKIQLQICYDLRFPEILRNNWDETNASASYDVLLFVANWPAKRGDHWRTLLKARAIENQCFVVGVNRVGKDQKGLNYSGDSVIFNANGENLNEFRDAIVVKNLILEQDNLISTQLALPFLQDQKIK